MEKRYRGLADTMAKKKDGTREGQVFQCTPAIPMTTVKHSYSHSELLTLESGVIRVIKVPHDNINVTVVGCVDEPLWMGGTSGGRGGFK